MNSYLRILRRRWVTVVAVGAIGLFTAVLVSVVVAVGGERFTAGSAYTASTTLLVQPDSPTTPSATAALAGSVGVARAAAAELGAPDNPAGLLDQVEIVASDTDRTVVLTAGGSTAEDAALLADAFGSATAAEVGRTATAVADRERETLQARLDGLAGQLDASDAGTRVGAARIPALNEQYAATFRALQELGAPGTAPSPVSVLVLADPAGAAGAPLSPASTPGRLLVGVVLGLLAGAALALLLERIESRPTDRREMQRIYRLPTLAEVPRGLPRRSDGGVIVAAETEPGGAVADAYRTLLSALMFVPAGVRPGPRPRSVSWPKVVLVASARPAEAKTTTVVNLAACVARTGRTALILDCDERAPEVHRCLEVTESPVPAGDAQEIDTLLGSTDIAGVSVVAADKLSGPVSRRPGWLAGVLDQARERADVVLIDTPPMLLGSRAVELVPLVDSIIVTTFVGQTTTVDAERLAEILWQMRAPAVGLVVVGGTAPRGSIDRFVPWPRQKAEAAEPVRSPNGHGPAEQAGSPSVTP